MKVAVAGASGAGLYLAYLLAREGVEAEVLEKARRIGWPPRTLIVTSKLSEVLGFEPEQAIINRVRWLELYSGERSVRLMLASPDLVLEREKFLLILARMANEAGAKISPGHEVLGFEQDVARGKIRVKVNVLTTGDIREVEADFLVGADGIQGRAIDGLKNDHVSDSNDYLREEDQRKGEMAWEVKAKKNDYERAAVFQLKLSLVDRNENSARGHKSGIDWTNSNENGGEKAFDPEICEVWFDPFRTKYFFWVIPESAHVAAVGLIADRMEHAEEALDTFLRERGISPAILDRQASLVPLPRFGLKSWDRDFSCSIKKRIKERSPDKNIDNRSHSNICFVGDAAGQVKATTVGGVVAGLRGAKAIAGMILGQKESLRDFRELKRELELHLLLRKVFNRFQARDYDTLLKLLEKDAGLRELLSCHNRDEVARFFPRLLLSHPTIFFLGARAFLRSLF